MATQKWGRERGSRDTETTEVLFKILDPVMSEASDTTLFLTYVKQ